MNVLLRKITIRSNEIIKVLNKKVKRTWFGFGKIKIKEKITKEPVVYEYWIEFRVDQGRFYYGERKPIENPNIPNLYTYQTNTIHTKRGLDKSLEIITEIMNRTETLFPNYEIELFQVKDSPKYRQFDKE